MFIRWKRSDREIHVRSCTDSTSWYYRTVARSNGQVIHTSETYSTKAVAIREAEKEAKDTGRELVIED